VLSYCCVCSSVDQKSPKRCEGRGDSQGKHAQKISHFWLLMVLLFAIVIVDDGALGLLVNLFVIYCETCDVCDIYVTFVIYVVLVIYMCC